MRFAVPTTGWIVALFLLLEPPAMANALGDVSLDDLLDLSLEELNDYPVTAPTRRPVALSNTPGAVSLITFDQIRRSSAQTIPELLRSVPGVNVRWNPMVQTIDVRGFGSNPFTNRVLLLIDGVPYNSWNKGGFPQHPGFDFFNINNIKHLEIIRGPGSALYGENAFNGVINIVTLSGDDMQGTQARLSVGARDTRSMSVSYGADFVDQGSLFVTARRLESRLPTELWRGTEGAESSDVFAKLRWGKFQASIFHTEDRFGGYVEQLGNGGAFRSAEKIEQEVDIVALNYQHESDSGRWAASANLSYAARDGSHCASCHGAAQNPAFRESTDHGNQIFANGQLSYQISENQSLLVGAETRELDAGDHSEELSGPGFVGHNHGHSSTDSILSYRKNAMFLQHELALKEQQLKLITGARYEGGTRPGLFGSEFFPRISAVYRPTEKFTFRAGWNRAARYPSFGELYQASTFLNLEIGDVAIPLASFIPNPDLQPEMIEAFELGIEYWPTRTLQIKADIFRNLIEDSIHIAYPQMRSENHPADAEISGLEVEMRNTMGESWEFYGNWSYQRNRQFGNGVNSAGDGIDFSYAPRHKINVGAIFQPTRDISATLDVRWKDEYRAPAFWYQFAFDQAIAPTALPAYALVDVKLNWNLPYLARDGKRPLNLSIAGRNLLDETPFETLTGFGGRVNGREWHIGFQYRFGQ